MATDKDLVRELEVFITNDNKLYNLAKAIALNQAKKKINGTYNKTLSVKAWELLAEQGRAKYKKAYGLGVVSKENRVALAKVLQEEYSEMVNDMVRQIKLLKKEKLAREKKAKSKKKVVKKKK